MTWLLSIDEAILFFINQELANPVFDWLMPFITKKTHWIPLYVFLFFGLIWKFKLKSIAIIITIGSCVGCTDLVSSHLLKKNIGRERPCQQLHLQSKLNIRVPHCGASKSMPSSHAANHFSLALIFMLLIKRKPHWLFTLAILWAAAIGYSRIYLGVHYPSDVLVGALLGTIIAYGFYRIYLLMPYKWRIA